MGLLQRITELLRSNINDLISKAEDPEKMLNSAIEEMQKQIIEAKSRVAASIADEKRLLKQFETEKAKSEDWEKKAMAAVRAGRDDLAVEALSKRKEHDAAANLFGEQLGSQKAAVDELKKALTMLTAKLEDTRRKRTLLIARKKRAEAQRQIADTLSAANEIGTGNRLEQLEARVERSEAEAEATWEMAVLGGNSGERDLAKQIDALSAGQLNEDLLALKGKMADMGMLPAGSKPTAALGPGEEEMPDTNPDISSTVESEPEQPREP